MALFYGKHKVQNFDTWAPYFYGDQDRLHNAGARTVSVMRSATDPNEVHFIFEVSDPAAFFGALQSPEVGELMQKAGVLEQPVVYRLEEMPH